MELQREAEGISNVTKGTEERRRRILRDLKSVGNNALALMRAWDLTLKPNVVISYTNTLLSLKPEFKSDRKVTVYLDALRQKGGIRKSCRAIPMSICQMKKLMTQSLPVDVKKTIWSMWISASRHVDLLKIDNQVWWQKGVCQWLMGTFKSDRYGLRAVSKFLTVIDRETRLWMRISPFRWATYRTVLYHLKKFDGDLTVHSVRRGAVTALANMGYSMKEIELMTAHTPTDDKHLAVRRYIDPTPNQPESKLQLRMSADLGKAATML